MLNCVSKIKHVYWSDMTHRSLIFNLCLSVLPAYQEELDFGILAPIERYLKSHLPVCPGLSCTFSGTQYSHCYCT